MAHAAEMGNSIRIGKLDSNRKGTTPIAKTIEFRAVCHNLTTRCPTVRPNGQKRLLHIHPQAAGGKKKYKPDMRIGC